ncbi:hypothetical protein B296_00039643 [Ensete ventricosum]|uniref:Uncharacterized protein n=1 Tax=Ensete ventricosum TaxID=4639 RepID=A0A426XL30_ENSVE|nr:hypothetical protein B296_00039643 [Ensete ventricosum]
MLLHPMTFSSINSRTILPSPQSQQPVSIAAIISVAPFFVDSVICHPCCLIPLMPLLSSAPVAQAAVATAVLFLFQLRCCLPPLCRQSCEQDRPGRASPTASPPQSQRALLPLCSSSASPPTRSCRRCNLFYQGLPCFSSARCRTPLLQLVAAMLCRAEQRRFRKNFMSFDKEKSFSYGSDTILEKR